MCVKWIRMMTCIFSIFQKSGLLVNTAWLIVWYIPGVSGVLSRFCFSHSVFHVPGCWGNDRQGEELRLAFWIVSVILPILMRIEDCVLVLQRLAWDFMWRDRIPIRQSVICSYILCLSQLSFWARDTLWRSLMCLLTDHYFQFIDHWR